MRNKTCGIYAIWVNNKPYVGSSKDIELRRKQHLQALARNEHYNPKLQRAWAKHGQSLRFELLFECEEAERFILEELTIAVLDSYHCGYNLTPNVTKSINFGIVLSSGHRKRIADATRKRYELQEERDKTSRSLKDFWATAKNRNELLATYRTPAYREKLREATTRSWEDPDIRERRVLRLRESQENGEFRKRISASLLGKKKSDTHCRNISRGAQRKYEDPVEREKTSQALKQPEVVKKLSAAGKRCWEDPERRARLIASRKAQWERPGFRAAVSRKLKEAWKHRKLVENKTNIVQKS